MLKKDSKTSDIKPKITAIQIAQFGTIMPHSAKIEYSIIRMKNIAYGITIRRLADLIFALSLLPMI